ncbi:holo-[acyl-carrier protein] synthase [Branchiibius hedensis]|uniref:Holo-[acyl-carrier-protein] synthase n=1 Tax=Branchiibius hedensis TaxID=672460 RepID=A0A2Y8ZRM9_9MICO|nr:holo-ACP synthase [Branchiibius hedensis]PWJ26209.1 holo-[acyl-carrier protein] synthase [Branchiibius hedensis]SSA35021.1 holo-[acyl-carrier protein] synthase [Branchiibius hedensis]
MILGVGIDVTSVNRFAEALERTPALAERVLVASERTMPMHSLAGRFAAKEALAKALGAPGDLAWHDAVVVTTPAGQPQWELSGTVAARMTALGATTAHLSISHDAGIATAIVIVEGP